MTMIYIFFLSFMLLFIDPFAPKADKPNNTNNDPDIALAISFLDNVKIPDKERVGLPSYHDARVFQTAEAGQMGSPLFMVRTFSEESVDQVLEFYKENIPDDWQYKDFFGIHYLWVGDENQAMMAQAPSIQITDADDFKAVWPQANAIITIYYK